MEKLEIYDRDKGGALAFQLGEVLSSLPRDAHLSEWRVLELEAVGPNVLVKEEIVKTSRNGLLLSWFELSNLADSLKEVINLKLCGYVPDESEPRLTIEVMDSTYWVLTTDMQSTLSWARHSFHNIHEVKLPSAL